MATKEEIAAQRADWEQKAIRAGEDRMVWWNKYLEAQRNAPNGLAKQVAGLEYKQKADALERQMVDYQNQLKGINPDGSPMRPDFESWIDPNTGNLLDQYKLKVDPLAIDSLEGLSALKKEAVREGPSKWAQMMLLKQQGDRSAAMNQAAGSAAQAFAQGRSGMAMRGGISSGARERLAGQTARDLIMAKQGVNKDATQNRYNLLGQDEQNRLATLGQFSTQEGNLAQFNKGNEFKQNEFNILRTLEENQAKRGDTLEKYKAELSKWGAEKQANATAASGGGGGGGGTWLCTKIHEVEPLSGQTRAALFILRKFSLKKDPELANCYLYECSELAERMAASGVNFGQLRWFTDRITKLVEEKKMDEALKFYVDTTLKFVKTFWSDTKNETLLKLLAREGANHELHHAAH